MSDYETIRGIFEKRSPLVEKACGSRGRCIMPDYTEREDGTKKIEVMDGYNGFVAVMDFDAEGNLESVSAWE